MQSMSVSEYNRDQRAGFEAVAKVLEGLSSGDLQELQARIEPYLAFRRELDDFHREHLDGFCRPTCYETGWSACCGFESIFTFFSDQLIAFLTASPEERAAILEILSRPNITQRCVYLGANGCLWTVRPISCAMFLCEDLKGAVLREGSHARALWQELQQREKTFTYPDRPVLFDDLEKYFLRLGVETPHMYFHRSPGLLRLKARFGLNG